MREIYLDNSATTRVAEPAAQAVYEMLVHCYGNPSSLHRKGLEAENRITAARESLANLLDCDPAQITFTSGGTEANNLALLGVAEARVRKGKRIVTTAFEHSSVDAAAGRLEQLGWEVVRVKPDVAGHIDAKKVVAAVDSSTVLVSCMCVNNEVGTILPIGQIVKGIRRRNLGRSSIATACRRWARCRFPCGGWIWIWRQSALIKSMGRRGPALCMCAAACGCCRAS